MHAQLHVQNSALAFLSGLRQGRVAANCREKEMGSLASIFDSVQSIDLAGSTVKAILDWLGGVVTSSEA
ncbi:hypothetical protein ACFTSD_18695 [Nocardiaceae bacterium NPDC056970]